MHLRKVERSLASRSGAIPALLLSGLCLLMTAGCGGEGAFIPDPGPSTGPLVFHDETFDKDAWTDERLITGPNGGSHSVAQRDSASNPYREVVATKNSTAGTGESGGTTVYSFRTLSVYRPREEGAITTIDFSIDARQDVMASGGTVMLALRQSGGRWTAPGSLSPAGRLVVDKTEFEQKARAGMTQDEFYDPERPGERPDFSASGDPITLGFAYGVSTVVDGGVSTRTADFDNWMVTLRRR